MMKSNGFWVILVSAVLLVSAIAALIVRGYEQGGVACVYTGGELIESIELSEVEEPYTFTVERSGGYNVVAVEKGRVYIADADCPDGACMRQGDLRGAAPIVCLPHGLVIKLEGGKVADVDAVAG